MKIGSKREMYALYEAGEFGNKLETWPSLDAFYASNVAKRVVMRYKGRAGGAWAAYDLAPSDVPAEAARWKAEGADLSLVTLNESAPDDLLLIQGEVMRSIDYLDLRYSRSKLPMRDALAKDQHHTDGAVAVALLRRYLDPSSYEDLWMLLDRYPDAVVEFSTWNTLVGTSPHRNTVFWEVRDY